MPPRELAHSMPHVGRSCILTKNTEQTTAPAQARELTATSRHGYVVLLLPMATTHTSQNIRKARRIMTGTIPRQRQFKPTNAADRRANTSRRSAAHVAMTGAWAYQVSRMPAPRTTTTTTTTITTRNQSALAVLILRQAQCANMLASVHDGRLRMETGDVR